MRFSLAQTMTLAAAVIGAGMASAQDGRVQTKQYDDGGIYEGTFQNGLQHGTGTYTLPNGYEYSGDWVEGEIRGRGVARFPNGSVYEGEFARGKPNGLGKIVFTDGGTYEGTWEDGKITAIGSTASRKAWPLSPIPMVRFTKVPLHAAHAKVRVGSPCLTG